MRLRSYRNFSPALKTLAPELIIRPMPEGQFSSELAPRFLVIQNGARHNYAIPAAFARFGTLAGVYTDFTAMHGLGKLLARSDASSNSVASALQRRTPPSEVMDAIFTNDMASLVGELGKRFFRGPENRERWVRYSKAIAEHTMLSRGTIGATHIYTMLGEGGRFVEKAKDRGLGIIGDVYIALSSDRIVNQEAEAFPDWTEEIPIWSVTPDARSQNSVLLECSDILICPSEFVRRDLIANHGVSAAKTCVIQYAVSPTWLGLPTAPEKGRLLFAGSATLRKGIHYLAKAASLLKGAHQVIVAGGVSEKVRNHPDAKDLVFLGHLGKAEMAAEFARADVFVFPSLAEGSASVTAEALGAGVPVITTMAAGSIVRDGVDGVIVPERDPVAIAQAARSIVEDREKRNAMSRAARERAQAFTWDGFADQVIEATRQISEATHR